MIKCNCGCNVTSFVKSTFNGDNAYLYIEGTKNNASIYLNKETIEQLIAELQETLEIISKKPITSSFPVEEVF